MRKKIIIVSHIILFAIIFTTFCTKTVHKNEKYPHQDDISSAKEKVRNSPGDILALQYLGKLYYKAERYKEAIAIFKQAIQKAPDQHRSICYLGLCEEEIGNVKQAMEYYQNYANIPYGSDYRQWLKGRLLYLEQVVMKQQMAALLQNSEHADSIKLDPYKVVVLPLTYHGENQTYFTLKRGLMGLITGDLTKVDGLSVVDDSKVAFLYKAVREKLTEGTHPNIIYLTGKLLGAGTVVRAGYNVLDGEQLVLDVAFWDLTSKEIPNTTTHVDSLENFYNPVNAIEEALLRKLEVNVSQQLKEEIFIIPTQNLHAFLAYSAGLAKEDARQYEEAVVFFEKAAELDVDFDLCIRKLAENRLLALSQQDPDQAVSNNISSNEML
ncbi:MAG: tetratricopeptide repeat protein [Calditrichae bacterium]|nr:tetratricopeptide repeat protein [Calditrichia bacterium]